MEKNTTLEKKTTPEALSLTNRKMLKLEGIAEIISSSETCMLIKMRDTNLTITGQNMHITRLDVNLGILDVDGNIDCIKYGKSANFFKRIFKWKFIIFFN